ncbi:ankyrin, partial [Melanomma pulvis-pyrius CBS 109.77]
MDTLIHIPLLGGTSALILLSLVHYVSAESDGSDFSNNLFSDLAPILALFGEKFAQQFMSESFSWLDHVVFAMAPLGIITAVVGAIRVGGPSWMRAIIGRARENRASAEVELMSSTSHEVCELWNGESVVRTLGRPLVKQIVVLRNEIHDETTFGLFTMEAAAKDRKMEWKVYNGPSISRWLKSYLPSPFTRIRRSNRSSSWAWDTDIERGNHPNLDETKDSKTKDATEKGADVKITDGETGKALQKIPTRARRTTKLEEAPNILLNLHHGSNTGDLVFAAIIGCILQFGVLVFSAFVTYHEGLSRRIPDAVEKRTNYGYPSLAAGTALLTIGMFIASSVIEQSTVEEKWRAPNPKGSPGTNSISDLQVLWLQKQHVVGDQSFDSYVLQAQEQCKEILTSRRSTQLAERVFRDNLPVARNSDSPIKRIFTRIAWTPTEFFTLLGSFIGLAGFILQFQGFRGVHWACALAQLAATGIMTTARAWIRRGLIVRPRADRVTSDHEMDWLVKNMALGHTRFWPEDDKSSTSLNKMATQNEEFNESQPWTITFAYQGYLVGAEPEDFRDRWTKRGQRAVDIRRRLQSLTNWTGPVSEHAVAVAAAIKKVMDTFLKNGRQFVWVLDMPLGGSIYQIRITIDRELSNEAKPDEADENMTNPWKDLSAEIESVLSLWLFDIKSKAGDESGDDRQGSQMSSLTSGKRNRYILGPNVNKSLGWDISWWISNDIAPEEREEEYDQAIKMSEREMVIGYRGERLQNEDSLRKVPFKETSITTLSVQLAGKTELLLAQHLFSGFMWSVANHIPREELLQPITFDTRDRFDIYDHTTWDFCKIQNSNLNALIRDVQRAGMGSLEEVSMFIIPALSYAGKLPSESIVELIRQRVRDNEIGRHWEESIQVYSELVKLVKDGITEQFLYKAIAAVVDFLIIARETEIPDNMIKSLEAMKAELFSDTILNKTRSIQDVTLDIRRLYVWQKRVEEYDNAFEEQIKDIATDESISRDEEDQSMRLFGYTECHKALVHDTHQAQDTGNWHSDMLSGDILGWTPLHYAVLRDPGFYAKYAKLLNIRARNEPRDIAERTPLHYAARLGRWNLGRSLSKHSDINAKGRDGMLPIHWAAKCGNLVMTKMLLDNGSHVNVNDNLRRTPLHLAVEHSHEAIIRLLLDAEAN